MKKRRSYIVDKEFQFKKTFTIVGMVSLIISVIIIAVGILITGNNEKIESNNAAIIKNTKNIRSIFRIQQDIIMSFSLMPGGGSQKSYAKTAGKMAKDYNNSMDILDASIKANAEMHKSNKQIMDMSNLLLVIIIVATIAGLLILYMQLIKQTHRISGPIFIMTRYINEILEGRPPDLRDLRDKDDFKEFYSRFKMMAERMIELEKKNSGKE